MTGKKDFGQRFEIDGQFAGYLKPTAMTARRCALAMARPPAGIKPQRPRPRTEGPHLSGGAPAANVAACSSPDISNYQVFFCNTL